jgi:3-oxoacyl-[acyl-carrier-protein] synthase-3
MTATPQPAVRLTGWGRYAPAQVLTNADLERMVDTSDEWIVSRTGIRERRVAAAHETTASMAAVASLRALHTAGLGPDEVDIIILATLTPDYWMPSTAALVKEAIGNTRAAAFDVAAACSGFVYAYATASAYIAAGLAKHVLVIGAELLTRFLDYTDRSTCILFGDGAGAFVLQASEEPGGVLSAILRSDGSGGDLLAVPAGGSRRPATLESVLDGLHYIQMNGREVYRFATRVMSQATQEAVEAARLQMDDIQLIIPHQANLRIIEAAVNRLDIPMERVMVNLEKYGNTSTASIPIATCEAIQQGRLKPGDRVVFVAFGAGLTWGSLAAQWSGPIPSVRKIRPRRFRRLARLRSRAHRLRRRVEGVLWGRGKTI